MIKEFTERGVAPSKNERFPVTRWTVDIQVTSLECDEAEQVEKTYRESTRPGSDFKLEPPPPASSKSLFLEAARLRNRNSQQFGVVGTPLQDAKPTRSVALPKDTIWADSLHRVRKLIQAGDLDEAQRFLDLLERQIPPDQPKVETVLETFDGVLNCIDGETASLTLTSTTTGQVFYAQYPTAEFSAKGIEEDDRFLCKTIESEGGTRIAIEAIPDYELTETHIRTIREKINEVLPPNDPDVRY